jgi:hypothetical protein
MPLTWGAQTMTSVNSRPFVPGDKFGLWSNQAPADYLRQVGQHIITYFSNPRPTYLLAEEALAVEERCGDWWKGRLYFTAPMQAGAEAPAAREPEPSDRTAESRRPVTRGKCGPRATREITCDDATRRIWEPLAGQVLEPRDLREIRSNFVGFMSLLLQLDEGQRSRHAT